jgi:hypothetical protein
MRGRAATGTSSCRRSKPGRVKMTFRGGLRIFDSSEGQSMMRTALVVIGICMMVVVPPPIQYSDQASNEAKRIIWANEPDVLAGITAVNLHVAIRGDAMNAQVGETALREQITDRLRAAGITVLADDQVGSADVPVMLTVIIECKAIERPGGSIPDRRRLSRDCPSWTMMVALSSRGSDAVVLGATTWARRSFGSSARSCCHQSRWTKR